MKIGEDSESTLMDLIVTDSLNDVNLTLKAKDLQLTIKKVFEKRLSTREKEVISMSFGLFGERQKTLEEIGIKFDLTRERVRQIKEKALRKLKQSSAKEEMREYSY